ncbi:MAG: precorrin-3B C(17)-methyltransferase [Syntrophales bacterium]|nr:precorrin-3B C(17)-methyltransferase [Syntrophales bacterium]
MAKNDLQRRHGGPGQGKLFVVGIGPGDPLDRTRRAEAAIIGSDVVVGYRQYLDLVEDLTKGKEIVASGMTQEVERCRAALRHAAAGKTVALVSSGDPGVYGMAGLALEMAVGEDFHATIEVIPGVPSANAAAARLGAPLMLDYTTISLSDLLVSWATIRTRLEAVAAADLVVALYNPRSRKRIKQLEEAAEIFRAHRPGATPVGIATAVGRRDEQIILSDLDHFLNEPIGMRSMVIIGNSASRTARGWFITSRGYRL